MGEVLISVLKQIYRSIFLDLDYNCEWVVKFTPLLLYSPFPMDRRLCDPRARVGCMEKWKVFILPGLKLRPFRPPARSQSLYRSVCDLSEVITPDSACRNWGKWRNNSSHYLLAWVQSRGTPLVFCSRQKKSGSTAAVQAELCPGNVSVFTLPAVGRMGPLAHIR
jgi:hypothetical protein